MRIDTGQTLMEAVLLTSSIIYTTDKVAVGRIYEEGFLFYPALSRYTVPVIIAINNITMQYNMMHHTKKKRIFTTPAYLYMQMDIIEVGKTSMSLIVFSKIN